MVTPSIVRPEYRPLLRSALVAMLAPTLLAVIVAIWAEPFLRSSAAFPACLLGMLVLGGLLVLYGLPAHGPHHSFGPANRVTLARGVLVAFLAALLAEVRDADVQVQFVVLGVASLAATLDAVDGWLARRTRMTSAFGARFDMETDALFILVLSLWAAYLEKAGPWVIASGLMRYGFVLSGALVPALRAPPPYSFRRKTIAAFQMVALLIAICPLVPIPFSAMIAGAALFALSLSFSIDIRWLLRHRTERVCTGADA